MLQLQWYNKEIDAAALSETVYTSRISSSCAAACVCGMRCFCFWARMTLIALLRPALVIECRTAAEQALHHETVMQIL